MKQKEVNQIALQEAILSFPVVPTWGVIGFERNDMPKDVKKAYEEAPKYISLEPYVNEWTRKRVIATPRLGVSYTGKENICWARPIVACDESYHFLKRNEIDSSKLPSLEEFLENPHFLHVELSLARLNPDSEEFSKHQLNALLGLFDTITEYGFHLDGGNLFREHPNRKTQYHLSYNADNQSGAIRLNLCGNLEPEKTTKLVEWFEKI